MSLTPTTRTLNHAAIAAQLLPLLLRRRCARVYLTLWDISIKIDRQSWAGAVVATAQRRRVALESPADCTEAIRSHWLDVCLSIQSLALTSIAHNFAISRPAPPAICQANTTQLDCIWPSIAAGARVAGRHRFIVILADCYVRPLCQLNCSIDKLQTVRSTFSPCDTRSKVVAKS